MQALPKILKLIENIINTSNTKGKSCQWIFFMKGRAVAKEMKNFI